MTDPIIIDLSDVDPDNVEHAYQRLVEVLEELLEEGITETELFSAIGDVLCDMSDPGDLAQLH